MKRSSWAWIATTLALTAAPGCVLKPQDDGSRFRDAVPQASEVEIKGPDSGGAATSGTNAFQPPSGVETSDPWASGPWAKYYGFTREVRKGVNSLTGVLLGGIWIVVNTQPTSVDAHQAIWGPYTDSLEPVTWRFRVEEVADGEYDYALEGRPKTSTSDADFRTVLGGKGYGRGDPRHGDGHFTLDLDAARELDPFDHQDESGTITVNHDLPPDITKRLSREHVVTAQVRPSDTAAWYDVTSVDNQDGTGVLIVNAHDDVDDSHTTAMEDVGIMSQWRADGAGRADITIAGGDVPASVGKVTAVECWASDFTRSYYNDSISMEPSEGDAAQCAYDAPPAL